MTSLKETTIKNHSGRSGCLLLCPLCNHQAMRWDISNHFQFAHNITLKTEIVNFQSLDEFYKWKERFEMETVSKYIRRSRTLAKKLAETHIYFVCKRSGLFVSKGENKRSLKKQGSCKMNGFCPAKISAHVKADGSVNVEYINCHIGHNTDLEHLLFSAQEKAAIADKLKRKILLDTILDDVKQSELTLNSNVKNIDARTNLGEFSVETWIDELRAADLVRFYKPCGAVSVDFPNTQRNAFHLIVMSDVQICGEKCIAIERLCGRDYNLVVLTAVDTRGCIPLAFFITTVIDADAMRLFITIVESAILNPSMIISDDIDGTWITALTKRIYAPRCVDRAWRIALSKINKTMKKISVYKLLRALLRTTDSKAFTLMMSAFQIRLHADPDTEEFAQFFAENYVTNCDRWAFCYYNNALLFETMSETLAYLYEIAQQRPDLTISAVMALDRQPKYDKNDCLLKHAISEQYDLSEVSPYETYWSVGSQRVERDRPKCTCRMRCVECKRCYHAYKCTCVDYSIKWNMCKHIHLLCRYLNIKSDKNTQSEKTLKLENRSFKKDLIHSEMNKILNVVNRREDLDMILGYINKIKLAIPELRTVNRSTRTVPRRKYIKRNRIKEPDETIILEVVDTANSVVLYDGQILQIDPLVKSGQEVGVTPELSEDR